jgi:xanthine dehydrogenase YagR molybdenum-binding subunit
MNSVGAPVSRIDGPVKVTGQAKYAADNAFPSMLHAVLVRSTVASGTVRAIDARSAMSIPGAIAVYTHENASEELFGRTLPDLNRFSLGGWFPMTDPDIHFAGQVVAIVVATSLLAAREAATAVRVEYDAEPASLDLNDRNYVQPSFFFGEEMQVSVGAACDAVKAPHTVRARFHTPVEHHHPMEPGATVADWQDGSLTLYDSTQGVDDTQIYVAAALGIPPDRVRVLSPYVGGGFGCKNQVWPHQAMAAFVSRRLNHPVKLVLSRADMTTSCGFRSETRQDFTLKANEHGELKAIRHIATVPTSMVGHFFEPCGLNTLIMYPAPSLEIEHHVLRQHISTPTVFRGPGETPGTFALECAMDELAHEMRMDPLDLRVRNYARQDFYHHADWSSKHLDECYRLGAERFGWPNHYVEPRSMRDGHDMIGFGLATTAYPAVAWPARASVEAFDNGEVRVAVAGHDIGTGLYTILAQVAVDELHVPLSAVRVMLGDTNAPEAPAAGRSAQTASVAPAVQRAARRLYEDLLQMTSNSHPSDQLSEIRTRSGPASMLKTLGLQSLAREASGTPQGRRRNLSFYSFGTHFVEVRVDEELGRLRVARVVTVLDCGRILNPKTASSQVKGAIVFGIGMALMEQTIYDPNTARVLTDNLADYHIPVNLDVPQIDVLFVNEPDLQFNELGARGLGEIGLPGCAAAIANAVYSAIGKRFRDLPITPTDLMLARDRLNLRQGRITEHSKTRS